MTIALACSWKPRGETNQLQRLREQFEGAYDNIVIALPPTGDVSQAEALGVWSRTTLVVSPILFGARFLAVQTALKLPVGHIHYADLDMLLRWVEDRPEEWRDTMARIQTVDCLITGRSERAFQTRPRAIRDTEDIINTVGTHLLGQAVDLGLGSRGLSQPAARCVIGNSQAGGWGDLEWPVIVQRAGFSVHYIAVDGVVWESPDQYRQEAADPETQRLVAEKYDKVPRNWSTRVRVVQEIIQEGIQASQRRRVD